MITTIVDRVIDRQEEQIGESMDYLRDIARASVPAFLKFGLFAPLAAHRSAASAEALAVVRLVATRHEDCGPCLQTCVRYALRDGVDAGVVRAVIAGQPERLPEHLARLYRFAEAVITASPEATALSQQTAEELGQKALVDLALAIAGVRVFPTVKRALGYAKSCSLVRVEV